MNDVNDIKHIYTYINNTIKFMIYNNFVFSKKKI